MCYMCGGCVLTVDYAVANLSFCNLCLDSPEWPRLAHQCKSEAATRRLWKMEFLI